MNLKQVCRKVHEDSETEKSTEKFSKIHSITPHHVSGNREQEISSGMIEKREKLVQMINMKEDGHSISEIARKTQTHWVTVKRYLAHGIPPIGRTTRVNYDIYTAEIEQMCSLEINPTAMFRSLKTIGLRCCERSFSRWFHLNFPNYEHKWNRTYPEPLKVTKPRLWPNFIPSARKLSIFVTNPEYGVAKDTGECSSEKEVVDNLIKHVPLLSILRNCHIDFRKILKNGCPDQLDIWIKNIQSTGRKKLVSFCEGLKKDLLAVKNAIIYDWTNGLVEGNVNRLKNKKREMYGRGGFELLRRKVCLSSTG